MSDSPSSLVVIGGGPAGLMAAEAARAAGVEVHLYDAMGSVGRKLLIAGKGGLNLTHSEPFADFVARYGTRADAVAGWLHDFGADALRAWARGLGIDTFVGSSGRVFPQDLKAAPLLRGWVRRLREQGVQFHVQQRFVGWDGDGRLRFRDRSGIEHGVSAAACVLALGGASWPVLGSDGAWVEPLASRGIEIAALQPANCGFDVAWSPWFAQRFAGEPLKPVALHWSRADGRREARQGEFVVTAGGVEGSLIYAASADLRDAQRRDGHVDIALDLAPTQSLAWLQQALRKPRGSRSAVEHLRRQTGLAGIRSAVIVEALGKDVLADVERLATAIKALPLRLQAPRPVDEAISTAGGVTLEAVDEQLMLRALPGVFCAGEMLDWEAPTGGYLLTASFASGLRAGRAAARWLRERNAAAPA